MASSATPQPVAEPSLLKGEIEAVCRNAIRNFALHKCGALPGNIQLKTAAFTQRALCLCFESLR
jgi:hypothetical protein